MSYDSKCYDLACDFLEDQPQSTEEDRKELAQLIQTTIEDYETKYKAKHVRIRKPSTKPPTLNVKKDDGTIVKVIWPYREDW